jgi:cytochrome c
LIGINCANPVFSILEANQYVDSSPRYGHSNAGGAGHKCHGQQSRIDDFCMPALALTQGLSRGSASARAPISVEEPGEATTTKESVMKSVMIGALVLAASAGAAMAQDVAAGETSFKKCAPCHDIGEDAKNKVGPELNGLDGRKSGTAPDYNYSDANKSSGITWNEESFKEYIRDPRAKVPGTKMIFPGIKNDEEVANLWAYIRQFGADGTIKQ